MKKLLSSVLIGLVLALTAFGTHNTDYRAVTNVVKIAPTDVVMWDLHTRNTNEVKDTILTTRANHYGPYPLSTSSETPMFKSMVIKGDVTTGGTHKVIEVDYQCIKGISMSDTSSSWTPACTLNATSATNCNVDLSSKIGKAIVIRCLVYDDEAQQIPGYMGIGFKENLVYNKSK